MDICYAVKSTLRLFTLVNNLVKHAIVVFTTHVSMFFGLNRHNFGDIELKFCILL